MKTLLLACAAIALSGCATGLLQDHDAASAAVRAALAAQVIDPAGARDAAPVSGLDGRAARQAQERYEKSFGAKEAAATYAPDMGTSQ